MAFDSPARLSVIGCVVSILLDHRQGISVRSRQRPTRCSDRLALLAVLVGEVFVGGVLGVAPNAATTGPSVFVLALISKNLNSGSGSGLWASLGRLPVTRCRCRSAFVVRLVVLFCSRFAWLPQRHCSARRGSWDCKRSGLSGSPTEPHITTVKNCAQPLALRKSRLFSKP